jgi:RNA polymerase sigma-70 factor (ECF subfamily)
MTALRSCVRRLPDKHQHILGLRYHADMSCAKIAEMMGTSCNAIFLLLSRVRTRLAQCIAQQLRKAGDA